MGSSLLTNAVKGSSWAKLPTRDMAAPGLRLIRLETHQQRPKVSLHLCKQRPYRKWTALHLHLVRRPFRTAPCGNHCLGPALLPSPVPPARPQHFPRHPVTTTFWAFFFRTPVGRGLSPTLLETAQRPYFHWPKTVAKRNPRGDRPFTVVFLLWWRPSLFRSPYTCASSAAFALRSQLVHRLSTQVGLWYPVQYTTETGGSGKRSKGFGERIRWRRLESRPKELWGWGLAGMPTVFPLGWEQVGALSLRKIDELNVISLSFFPLP